MYKHFYLFAFVIINFLSCASESSEKETEADQIKDVVVKNGNSLLWKIEGNGCTPSYMYGTMHMINKEYYHFTDGMRERIASS
ncbi:MAG: hypothetical protein ACI857_001617, partial [Arenicella sp.]